MPDHGGGGEGYSGILEAHPYKVASLRDGSRVVADAAGNDLIRVTTGRKTSTLAVLPPQPVVVTAEDPSLGARGSLYRVNTVTGAVELVATGFLGATDLAVAPNGTVYVAELFGGRISKVVDGSPQTVAEVPFPAAVEWAKGTLYATIDARGFATEGGGSLVTITP